MKTQTNRDATLSTQGTGDTIFHLQVYKYLENICWIHESDSKGKPWCAE